MWLQASFRLGRAGGVYLTFRSAYPTPMLQKWEKCALPRSFLTLLGLRPRASFCGRFSNHLGLLRLSRKLSVSKFRLNYPSLDFARDKFFNCSIFPVIRASWLLSFDGLSSRWSKHFAKHQRHRLSKPPFSFLTNREVAFHVGKFLLS